MFIYNRRFLFFQNGLKIVSVEDKDNNMTVDMVKQYNEQFSWYKHQETTNLASTN